MQFISKQTAILLITLLSILSLGSNAVAEVVPYGDELKNTQSATPSVSFTDLPQSHWAYKYIAEMVNKKVIEGYPDNKFRPGNTISRAEFATIIIKAAGLQAKKVNYSSFSDIKVTDWYSPYIETAKDYLTGFRTADGNYIFNPTVPASREDITVALVKLKGYDVSRLANRSTVEAMFSDFDGISESAIDYVAIAVNYGLVSGYEDGTFRPQNSLTRAEATTMLWRAFQYGNDNKGVGGSGSTPSSPTDPVTQPGQPNPATNTPNQATKFSVDTLVGGTGQGDVDGPVSMAKINQVDSMVLDKDNNIFFLDSSKKKIREFSSSNGSVGTFRTINNEFDWSYKNKDNRITYYENQSITPKMLAYNSSNNKVYLYATYRDTRSYDNFQFIYDLAPSVQMNVYNLQSLGNLHTNFFHFIDGETFIYSEQQYFIPNIQNGTYLYRGKLNGEISGIGSSQDQSAPKLGGKCFREDCPNGLVDGMISNDQIKLFDTYTSKYYTIQIFPRKVNNVVTYDKQFESVASLNGKLYASSGATVFEIGSDGSLTTFIDGKNLTYNDGNPIHKISQMIFDSKGNIILYDDENKAIRRINL